MISRLMIEARTDDMTWNDAIHFRAFGVESGIRTAATKLGLTGPVLTTERVGASQYLANVDGKRLHVIVDEDG